jgi:Protein of unknown function (DUF2397)
VLRTDGAVRLAAFGRLPEAEFAELLALLATGLDAPSGVDGMRRAMSVDGRVEIALRDPGDGRMAELPTDLGVLRGPDLLVSISLLDSPDAAAEAAGA